MRAKLIVDEQEITVRTLDISEGGVGVISPVEIAEGKSYVIEFVLPTVKGCFAPSFKREAEMGLGTVFSSDHWTKVIGLLRRYPAPLGYSQPRTYAARDGVSGVVSVCTEVRCEIVDAGQTTKMEAG